MSVEHSVILAGLEHNLEDCKWIENNMYGRDA